MAKVNKYMDKLMKLDGAVNSRSPSIYQHVIPSTSDSVNFMFGPGGGLPRGFSMVIGGAPKGGKSLMVNSFIGGAHRAYENGIVVRFDCELKSKIAFADDNKLIDAMGVDRDRVMPIDTNEPQRIFDVIEKDLYAMHQDGADFPLIIIDPINMVEGRRTGNSDTVMQQQIGDRAATIGDGLTRILPIIRKMNTSLILTCQIRADIGDGMKYELGAKRYQGSTIKLAIPYTVKHLCEYWVYVDRVGGKAGIKDFDGKDVIFANDDEQFAHRIRAQMLDASAGPKARTAEFTLDYKEGIINSHEEVFTLGIYTGVITKPNQQTYAFGELNWRGKGAILKYLADDKTLCDQIMAEVRKADAEGRVKKLFMDDSDTAEE